MEITPLLILALFFVATYVMLIRPQLKQRREHEELIARLEVGQDVVTAGGVHGTVVELDSDTADLLVTDDVVLRFQKQSVARIVGAEADGEETAGDAVDDRVDVEAETEER